MDRAEGIAQPSACYTTEAAVTFCSETFRFNSQLEISMGKRFYVVTRDVHLYVGLFLIRFVLVFAVSSVLSRALLDRS